MIFFGSWSYGVLLWEIESGGKTLLFFSLHIRLEYLKNKVRIVINLEIKMLKTHLECIKTRYMGEVNIRRG